jgi:hypothetical protein
VGGKLKLRFIDWWRCPQGGVGAAAPKSGLASEIRSQGLMHYPRRPGRLLIRTLTLHQKTSKPIMELGVQSILLSRVSSKQFFRAVA